MGTELSLLLLEDVDEAGSLGRGGLRGDRLEEEGDAGDRSESAEGTMSLLARGAEDQARKPAGLNRRSRSRRCFGGSFAGWFAVGEGRSWQATNGASLARSARLAEIHEPKVE